MAVQVTPVQKKEDQMGGMLKGIGTSFLQSKMGGAGGAAAAKPEEPKAPIGGSGTSLGEQINAMPGSSANQSSAASPRDRRMARGY